MVGLKKRIIDIEAHALLRVLERGLKYGLDYYETKDRAFKTVMLGNRAKRRHLSRKNITYCQYFNDNLSFYVICQEKEFEDYIKCLIRTVIIEEGRQ